MTFAGGDELLMSSIFCATRIGPMVFVCRCNAKSLKDLSKATQRQYIGIKQGDWGLLLVLYISVALLQPRQHLLLRSTTIIHLRLGTSAPRSSVPHSQFSCLWTQALACGWQKPVGRSISSDGNYHLTKRGGIAQSLNAGRHTSILASSVTSHCSIRQAPGLVCFADNCQIWFAVSGFRTAAMT